MKYIKNLFFVLAFMLIGTSFATNGKVNLSNENYSLFESSCTVSVKSGGYDVTITVTCDCTMKQACDTAYKIASIGIK